MTPRPSRKPRGYRKSFCRLDLMLEKPSDELMGQQGLCPTQPSSNNVCWAEHMHAGQAPAKHAM